MENYAILKRKGQNYTKMGKGKAESTILYSITNGVVNGCFDSTGTYRVCVLVYR